MKGAITQNSSKELRELEDRICEALLLGFKNPIKQDYNIPGPDKIKAFCARAVRKVCYVSAKNRKFIYQGDFGWVYLLHPEMLQERVREGLQKVFMASRDERNALQDYMFGHGFGSLHLDETFITYYGDLFRFKEGVRERAEAMFNRYWNSEEQKNFRIINRLMSRYSQKYFATLQKALVAVPSRKILA